MRIVITIERHNHGNIVSCIVGPTVMFNADHVAEETLPAVVRCVAEYWIAQTAPAPKESAGD